MSILWLYNKEQPTRLLYANTTCGVFQVLRNGGFGHLVKTDLLIVSPTLARFPIEESLAVCKPLLLLIKYAASRVH
jgi:hypothetical protein